MSNAISDTAKQSRKGRKPINGRAMTAAERKQRQRKAAKTKRQEMPSWLKLRHDIWQLVQDRFMFANATELANALDAVGAAICFTTVWAASKGELDSTRFVATMLGNREPEESDSKFFRELLPYKRDEFVEQQAKGYHDLSFLDVLRDMLGESQN